MNRLERADTKCNVDLNFPEMDQIYDLGLPDKGKDILLTQSSRIHGYGLFTAANLPAGTILCRRLGLRAALSLRDKRAILGIDGLDSASPEDNIFKNINHSCEPNALLTDTGCLINKWPLAAGAEITIDYDLLLAGSPWSAACFCGQPRCRHIIKATVKRNGN
jgi:SET domain-containing protein